MGNEGCLSFPDIHGEVPRSSLLKVHAQRSTAANWNSRRAGMLARAIQHEVDHLNGVLYIDRMNSATKVSLGGRLKRLQKEGAANPSRGQARPIKRQPATKPARMTPAQAGAEADNEG